MTRTHFFRSASWLCLFALVASFAYADGTPAEARDVIKKSFDVREGGTLYLDLDHANIEIETGAYDVVHIEIERIVNARNEDEAKKMLAEHELEFDHNSDDVRLRSRFDRDRWSRKIWGRDVRFKVEVTVHVPARYNVDFTNGAGNIHVADLEGTVDGRTGAGNVVIGRVRGPVEVSSGSGNITVDGARGRIRVNSGAGNIVLRDVVGEIRANTGAGNITARITEQPRGDSRLESGAGNVTAYLDDDASVYVDATAAVGSASCDFPLKVEGRWMSKSFGGRINGGGPELTLRSGVGNVSLRRL